MAIIGRRKHFVPLIKEVAKSHNLPAIAVEAIIEIESDFDPWAVRYEPNYQYTGIPNEMAKKHRISNATEIQCQKISWGLMQIMGGTARWMGYEGPLTQLLDPRTNLNAGCKYLAKLSAKYPDITDMVAAYNAGAARQKNGQYANQPYVDKFGGALKRAISDMPPTGTVLSV